MKTKIFAAIILALVMLTGCEDEKEQLINCDKIYYNHEFNNVHVLGTETVAQGSYVIEIGFGKLFISLQTSDDSVTGTYEYQIDVEQCDNGIVIGSFSVDGNSGEFVYRDKESFELTNATGAIFNLYLY